MNVRTAKKEDLKYYFIGKLICNQKFDSEEVYMVSSEFKKHREEKPLEPGAYPLWRGEDALYPAAKFPGDISVIDEAPKAYFIQKFKNDELLYNEEFEVFKKYFASPKKWY